MNEQDGVKAAKASRLEKAYDEAIGQATKTYEEAQSQALKVYNEACDQAWKAFYGGKI